MGRINKATGEFTPKPSVTKKISRMYGDTRFSRALRKGTVVKVFMGAGWEKGTVVEWSIERVTVKLARGNRSTVCYDSRNLEVTS